MRRIARLAALCVAFLALLAASVPAAAAPKRIIGKLSKPGYTVIALAANGKAKAARTRRGRFRLRPPARRVTLHLRAPNGTYAGPIVVGRKRRGRRAILGVRAGARLGRINVRSGYAKVKKRLRKKWVDRKRLARARRGVPIGARNFGRVRSRRPRRAIPGDRDFDGVPDPLDIDDDGDLILDTVDRATAARAAQPPSPPTLALLPLLSLSLDRTANANHPALAARIDTALPAAGRLILGSGFVRGSCPPGALCAATTELDCAGDPAAVPPRPGLVYCSRGGTGRLWTLGSSYSELPRFPECCDPDNDGFGTVPPFSGNAQLAHGATSAQIKTGDVLIERGNDAGGVETGALTGTLPYAFATVPALVRYSDTAGNSATVSYPAPGPDPATGVCPPPGPPCSGPGTRENPFAVAAGPDGHVVVTLTFWRPQRRRIAKDPAPKAGESSVWTDIGGLNYTAGLGFGECGQSGLSESDPNLTDRGPFPLGAAPGLRDARQPPDQPANPNETLTFTLDITRCLASQGFASSFDESGEVAGVFLIAGGGGRADQTMSFKRK